MNGGAERLPREHGLQVTDRRLAVLRAVGTHPHATADEIADDVRGSIGSISRQAVYDAGRWRTPHRRRVDPGAVRAPASSARPAPESSRAPVIKERFVSSGCES